MLANWLQNSLPEELAMYILSLTVQDPDSLPEVEIARENHCHLNHLVVALVERQRGLEMAVVETNAVTEIAEMT